MIWRASGPVTSGYIADACYPTPPTHTMPTKSGMVAGSSAMGSIAPCLRVWMGCHIHLTLLKALSLALNQGHKALKARLHCMVSQSGGWVLVHMLCRMGSMLRLGRLRGWFFGYRCNERVQE